MGATYCTKREHRQRERDREREREGGREREREREKIEGGREHRTLIANTPNRRLWV